MQQSSGFNPFATQRSAMLIFAGLALLVLFSMRSSVLSGSAKVTVREANDGASRRASDLSRAKTDAVALGTTANRDGTGKPSVTVHIPRVASAAHISVSTPVLPADPSTGMWDISKIKGLKKVWLDVGAHEKAMYTLPQLVKHRDLAVIAFEPMYDKWGKLSTQTIMNTDALPQAKDGMPPSSRFFPIPAAVSAEAGFRTFHRAGTDMCSSLNPVDPKANSRDWPGGCTTTIFKSTVPAVRLDEIISRVPRGIDVEFLKIDAQGGDFDVVRSAGELIKRVSYVFAEVQVKKALYANTSDKAEFIKYMKARGFELAADKVQNREGTEENLYFVNKGKGISAEKLNIPREPRHGGWSGVF